MIQETRFPLNFIQTITKNHLLLFYDSVDYAREIQCQFLKEGLKKNEICYFVTSEIKDVENELKKNGIDIESDEIKKQFKIINIKDSKNDVSGILKNSQEKITQVPIRIVGDKVLFSNDTDDLKLGFDFERHLHELFPNFNGNILCSYHVSSINEQKRSEIVDFLFSHHHSVMFAPENNKGTSFYLNNN